MQGRCLSFHGVQLKGNSSLCQVWSTPTQGPSCSSDNVKWVHRKQPDGCIQPCSFWIELNVLQRRCKLHPRRLSPGASQQAGGPGQASPRSSAKPRSISGPTRPVLCEQQQQHLTACMQAGNSLQRCTFLPASLVTWWSLAAHDTLASDLSHGLWIFIPPQKS